MGAPAVQVGRDAGQDLRVEVEAEVVAGGEVEQPLSKPTPLSRTSSRTWPSSVPSMVT
jgi:hypothetical protein